MTADEWANSVVVPEGAFNMQECMDALEKRILSMKLAENKGSFTETAKQLGLSWRQCRYWMTTVGVEVKP